jgi:histone H2A
MSGKGAKGLSGKGAKGTMGDKKGDKKKPISRSARAGLQFPVGRIHRLLKVRTVSHVAAPLDFVITILATASCTCCS